MQCLWYVVDIEDDLIQDTYSSAVVLYCTDTLQNRTWFYENFYRPSIPPNLHYRKLPTRGKSLSGIHRHVDNRISLGHNISMHSNRSFVEQEYYKKTMRW